MSDPVPTDAELIRRTVAGGRGAFARLSNRYARLVRAVACDDKSAVKEKKDRGPPAGGNWCGGRPL